MSATNNPGKKIIRTTPRATDKAPAGSRKSGETGTRPLLYGRTHYILMGAGILLIALGLVLMAGGSMPSPDVWDESRIYSPRRTVLAPIVMLSGIAIEIYAIFKKA